jgi:hypothetical protein
MAMPAGAEEVQYQVLTMGEYHGTLAHLPDSGPIQINWQNVEATAADPKSYMNSTARLMLAVRDGTWVPLEEPK